jgi:hypothetical protein
MAFEAVNVSSFIGQMSPHALSLAVNSAGYNYAANASDETVVGVVKAALPQGKCRVVVRADAAYASGESSALSLEYLNSSGTDTSVALITLDDTNVTAAGEFTLESTADLSALDVGSVVRLDRVYTAGGGPADPAVSIALQLY